MEACPISLSSQAVRNAVAKVLIFSSVVIRRFHLATALSIHAPNTPLAARPAANPLRAAPIVCQRAIIRVSAMLRVPIPVVARTDIACVKVDMFIFWMAWSASSKACLTVANPLLTSCESPENTEDTLLQVSPVRASTARSAISPSLLPNCTSPILEPRSSHAVWARVAAEPRVTKAESDISLAENSSWRVFHLPCTSSRAEVMSLAPSSSVVAAAVGMPVAANACVSESHFFLASSMESLTLIMESSMVSAVAVGTPPVLKSSFNSSNLALTERRTRTTRIPIRMYSVMMLRRSSEVVKLSSTAVHCAFTPRNELVTRLAAVCIASRAAVPTLLWASPDRSIPHTRKIRTIDARANMAALRMPSSARLLSTTDRASRTLCHAACTCPRASSRGLTITLQSMPASMGAISSSMMMPATAATNPDTAVLISPILSMNFWRLSKALSGMMSAQTIPPRAVAIPGRMICPRRTRSAFMAASASSRIWLIVDDMVFHAASVVPEESLT